VWWRRERKDVSEFLYRLLVSDAPRGYARGVAERMGIPYPTLAKYWLGKRGFPASLVKPLFLATGEDRRVAEFFLLEGSNFRLERHTGHGEIDDLGRAILSLGRFEARVAELYLEATAPASEDGERVSAREAERLRGAVQELIAHAESLRGALRRS
jgi:hypothetical protein